MTPSDVRLFHPRPESADSIDYRHIIWSLVRKPGAIARYRYREDMFPTLVFRRAYDRRCAPASRGRLISVIRRRRGGALLSATSGTSAGSASVDAVASLPAAGVSVDASASGAVPLTTWDPRPSPARTDGRHSPYTTPRDAYALHPKPLPTLPPTS